LYAFFIPSICAVCPIHLILDFIIVIIKSVRVTLC
jgi:hypothetical protein